MLPNDDISRVAWREFLLTTVESLLSFYIATFCMAMVITHRGSYWVFDVVVMTLLYIFSIIICGWRVFHKLSLATTMLIIPIAPFIALAIVLSLIPVLQFFR